MLLLYPIINEKTVFPKSTEQILLLLGLMNSQFCQIVLSLINPTINYYTNDIERIPLSQELNKESLINLVEQAIALAKQDSAEDETTWDFVAPPP